MKNLLKVLGIFVAGMVADEILTTKVIEKGDVIYNDDEMYIKATKTRYGDNTKYARVYCKKPQ